jgi:hypothetical protein
LTAFGLAIFSPGTKGKLLGTSLVVLAALAFIGLLTFCPRVILDFSELSSFGLFFGKSESCVGKKKKIDVKAFNYKTFMHF